MVVLYCERRRVSFEGRFGGLRKPRVAGAAEGIAGYAGPSAPGGWGGGLLSRRRRVPTGLVVTQDAAGELRPEARIALMEREIWLAGKRSLAEMLAANGGRIKTGERAG